MPRTPRAGLSLRQRAEGLAAPLPALLVAAERVAQTVSQGVHGRRRVGLGEAFWQYRRYETGDSLNRIDWRRSARSDELFVREQEWEASASVWLWCDGSPSMRYRSAGMREDKHARAALLSLALAVLLIRAGERVARIDADAPPSSGRAVLERLARDFGDDGAPAASLPPARPLPRHARLVLISDWLAPVDETVTVLRRYAAAGVGIHLVQVLDPSEEDFPFTGRLRLEGPEGEGALLLGRAESVRATYLSRLAARRDEMRTRARIAGWTFTTHRTDRAPQTALLALHAALAGERMGLSGVGG